MQKENINQLRLEALHGVHGEILEIGFGTGLNANCYSEQVTRITAIDTIEMKAVPTNLMVDFRVMSVTEMEFADETFDTVVSTFTLCSVDDLQAALNEIRRVLKMDGQFIFLEHGKSVNRVVAWIQNLVNPLYRTFACGCNVNRDFSAIMAHNGFANVTIKKQYIKTRPITGLIYSGIACKGGIKYAG